MLTHIELNFNTKYIIHMMLLTISFDRDASDAEKARKHLDGTYIGAAKIRVEECKALTEKPRSEKQRKADVKKAAEKSPEKQPPKKSSKDGKKLNKEKKKRADAVLAKYEGDPKFQEFLRVHKRNAEVWDNDAVLECAENYKEQTEEKYKDGDEEDQKEESDEGDTDDVDVARNKSVSDLDYLKAKTVKEKDKKPKKEPKNETYFTVKLSGLPYKVKKKDVKLFFKPLKPKSVRLPQKSKGFAYVGFATEADRKKAVAAKNRSFIEGHQVHVRNFDKPGERKGKFGSSEQQQEGDGDADGGETVAESGRLFVRNLSYEATEDDLTALFSAFGPLAEVTLPVDRLTKKIKGFAFITYVMPENAVEAFGKLDGTSFQGRQLHLLPGKAKLEPEELAEAAGLPTSSYKAKKAKKEKAQAGSAHNWNTLFLGASAVADLMADKYGVSKGDVLSSDTQGKQSAAVRLALGETQIVAETRKFLEEEGIRLDAFEGQPKTRSKTVILAKNLPARTAVEELRDLFAPHGDLARVVLPPNGGVTALVEFLEAAEARKAFMALAYTKFKNAPLYLEWAPDNAFKTAAASMAIESKKEEEAKVEIEQVAEDEEPEDDTTLFVKNLNFETSDEGLRSHFAAAGPVHTATVARKRRQSDGQMLSMGYGFVQFKRKSAVSAALKTLQHKMLDRHSLELKRSTRATSDGNQEVKTARKKSSVVTAGEAPKDCAKLVARNVAFEATEREVRDIFKTFGELKSVRLPKKVTGSHRGFAFVEFQSAAEAKRAMEALRHSTHLYGRRLVLEWAAEEEETVEALRRKTAASNVADSAGGGGGPSSAAKRRKKDDLVEAVKMAL